MKNEPLALEAEAVEGTVGVSNMGLAFNHANTVKVVPVEVEAEAGPNAGEGSGDSRATLGELLKPALSNVFLLGCLLGLFVLYCCSCIIHVLTFHSRRKSS